MDPLPLPETDAADATPEARPSGRRGHWSVHTLGLLVCLALATWCLHWLTSAQLSGQAGQSADTSRYLQAALLMVPAVSGICFFSGQLWGWRWLLWLALVFLLGEILLLVAFFLMLRLLQATTLPLTGLLGLGVVACLGAAYGVLRQRRR